MMFTESQKSKATEINIMVSELDYILIFMTGASWRFFLFFFLKFFSFLKYFQSGKKKNKVIGVTTCKFHIITKTMLFPVIFEFDLI